MVSHEVKPAFHHALVILLLTVIIALLAASSHMLRLTAHISVKVLDLMEIKAEYLSRESLMRVRLIDGAIVAFPITIQCSGLITLLIFAILSAFTVGLLTGALITKLTWFISSITLGYAWKTCQLASIMAIAHTFGLDGFTFARYILAPSTDFAWIVSLWAVGMSWLRKEDLP